MEVKVLNYCSYCDIKNPSEEAIPFTKGQIAYVVDNVGLQMIKNGDAEEIKKPHKSDAREAKILNTEVKVRRKRKTK